MPETMQAAVLAAPNAPLALERIPVPTPKRGEILVEVTACGVCHTDLHVIKGEVAFPTPAVLGHEISGSVVELGDGADLRVGERVAVVATGGVGSLIVQFARAQGALQVVAVDVGAEKLEAARRMGATDTVDAGDGDAVAKVLELTGGGADVVFEALGRQETVLQAVEMLRDGGRLVAVGITPADVRVPIDVTRLVRRGLRIQGSYGARPRSDMPRLLALIERGVLTPHAAVTRRYPLDEAPEAYQALDRREIVGRAIVTMPAAG